MDLFQDKQKHSEVSLSICGYQSGRRKELDRKEKKDKETINLKKTSGI
jgi:hypothetical protein